MIRVEFEVKPLLNRRPPENTSAYVSIRQHMSAYVSIVSIRTRACRAGQRDEHSAAAHQSRRRLPTYIHAYVSIRQHTSAYVSIRQHTSEVNPLLEAHLPRVQRQGFSSVYTEV